MSEVGLVLAAGAATRFGSPKQLADFRGAPLLTWPIRALHAGGLERIVVVLGANADLIVPVVPSTADTIVAADWEEGLSASLRAGVAAAAELDAERVLVALADQPLLHADAVARILRAARQATATPIVRASYDGTPGHPIALSSVTFAAVNSLRGDAGARKLIGFGISDVPCDGLGSPMDIDRPEDLGNG